MTAALSMHTHPPPFPVVCSCPISFRVASSNFSAASVVITTASARSSMDWLVVFVAVGKSCARVVPLPVPRVILRRRPFDRQCLVVHGGIMDVGGSAARGGGVSPGKQVGNVAWSVGFFVFKRAGKDRAVLPGRRTGVAVADCMFPSVSFGYLSARGISAAQQELLTRHVCK